MIVPGMFLKAEMRATAADGGENSGKILHRNRNCFTQPTDPVRAERPLNFSIFPNSDIIKTVCYKI